MKSNAVRSSPRAALTLLLVTLAPAAAAHGRELRTFLWPQVVGGVGVEEYPAPLVDKCLFWGTDCGQPAASAFCLSEGFERATSWTFAEDFGFTFVLGALKPCHDPTCDGFETIECVSESRPAPPIPNGYAMATVRIGTRGIPVGGILLLPVPFEPPYEGRGEITGPDGTASFILKAGAYKLLVGTYLLDRHFEPAPSLDLPLDPGQNVQYSHLDLLVEFGD